MRPAAWLLALLFPLAAAAPGRCDPIEEPLRLRAEGKLKESDDAFRALMSLPQFAKERDLGELLRAWKGDAVAGRSFIARTLRTGLLPAASARSRAFGDALLKQGYLGLACVEYARAEALGDASEALRQTLLMCGKELRTTAMTDPKRLTYPSWLAWTVPLQVQGLPLGALWRNNRLIYPTSFGGNSAAVRSYDPLVHRLFWEWPLSPDLPPLEAVDYGKDRIGRAINSLTEAYGVVIVEYETDKQFAEPGRPLEHMGTGTVHLDEATGAVKSKTESHNPPRSGRRGERCPRIAALTGRCRSRVEDEDAVYVVTDLGEVARVEPRTDAVLWRTQLDAKPRSAPAVFDDVLLYPGPELGLTALDISTGKRLWRYPARTAAPIDAHGPFIVLVRTDWRIDGLSIPQNLKARRAALLKAVQAQTDKELKEEIVLTALDADPSFVDLYAELASLAKPDARSPEAASAMTASAVFDDFRGAPASGTARGRSRAKASSKPSR